MVPFHALSQRLAETALRGGRLRNAGIYYFHNYPLGSLYGDPHYQTAEDIAVALNRLRSNHAGALIFSDAGAARGGYNLERIEQTAIFLQQLQQQLRYLVWLNPVPRLQWSNTTARDIAQLVPMFELSRRGLDSAIATLRGKRKS